MWSSLFSSSMKDVFIINALNCNVLYFSAVTSSIYIIITTVTFILLSLITSQIVFILIIVIIIVIIIIFVIIIITIININPPFSLSKLLKLWLSLQLLCSQDLNRLLQLRRNVNDQRYLVCWLCSSMLQSEWYTWLQVKHGSLMSLIKSDHMQIPFKFAANLNKASLIYIMGGIS